MSAYLHKIVSWLFSIHFLYFHLPMLDPLVSQLLDLRGSFLSSLSFPSLLLSKDSLCWSSLHPLLFPPSHGTRRIQLYHPVPLVHWTCTYYLLGHNLSRPSPHLLKIEAWVKLPNKSQMIVHIFEYLKIIKRAIIFSQHQSYQDLTSKFKIQSHKNHMILSWF